jgi:hypothetical protein
LTFHNNKLEAWTALRNALSGANFTIVGLATVSAENATDHCKRNKRAFVCDLVIECIPSAKPSHRNAVPVTVRGRIDTVECRNLLAVGRALAETVNNRLTADLKELYEGHLGRMGESEKLIH